MKRGCYIRTIEHRNKMRKVQIGHKLSEETKEKLRTIRLKSGIKGENHPSYKKDNKNLSYGAIHDRIRKKYGEPKYCEHCKRSDRKAYDWANKDHKYSLNIEDWKRLCRSCHNIYDITFNN